MRIQTKWFGEIEIDKDKVITFDRGIIGFDEFKQFTIVYDAQKDAQSSTMWLQSLDEVSLALPVIKPELIFEKYDPIVEDELINSLGENIKDAELLVLVTLTVTQDIKEMTCNLKAPIIINVDTMRGVQLIADNDDYMVRYPIYNILEQNSRKDGDQDASLVKKKDEAIVVNDNIEITIIDIKGDQVKLGISAPKSIPIYRKEVYVQIQNANKEAAGSIDIKELNKLFKK